MAAFDKILVPVDFSEHSSRAVDRATWLAGLYGVEQGQINSVHHQAIDTLGEGLRIEARCPDDGIVESVRYRGEQYAVGVQWHPEFQQPQQTELLSTQPLLDDFSEAIRRRWAVGSAM